MKWVKNLLEVFIIFLRYGQETKNTFPSILTEAYSEPSQTSKMNPIKEIGSIVGV